MPAIRTAIAVVATLLSLQAARLPLTAQDRLIRRYGAADGLQIGSVQRLAQDSAGFLWIGGVGGLRRWDGLEMRRWSADRIDSWVTSIAVCPDGRVHVVEEGGSVFAITRQGADPLLDANGAEIVDARSVACDAGNRVWIVSQDGLDRRDPGGRQLHFRHSFSGQDPLFPQAPAGSGVWLSTTRGFWHIAPDGRMRPVADIPAAIAVALGPRGDTLVLSAFNGAYRVASGVATRIMASLGRGVSMVVRGATVWIAFDRSIAALREDEPVERIGSSLIPEGGGPLLVDREGSLWMGTFSGLLQFPEPETGYWNDRHGLPSAHTRFVARQGGRTWISAWQGLGWVERRNGEWQARTAPPDWASHVMLNVDARGMLWIPSSGRLLEVEGDRLRRARPLHGLVWDMDEVPGGDWISTDVGLQFAAQARSDLVPVSGGPFAPGSRVRQALLARDGRAWLASAERICATTEPVTSPGRVVALASFAPSTSWTCDSIAGAVEITGLADMPSGAIWAASSRLGVLRRHDGRWERHPGNVGLTSRATYRLVPTSDGSVWILGFSVPVRVRERTDLPMGWEIVESVSAWQGLASEAQDVAEDDDGTLWFATSLGLARVPSTARRTDLAPPPVALVEIRVDGETVDADRIAHVRHRHNRVEVRWAALSFRDPTLTRYQVRLAPARDWIDQAGPPAFGWIDLPQGRYTAEVRASLDGRAWTTSPASFSWTVQAPWFLQSWAIALALVLFATGAYLVHRIRVTMLVRLERQRTRIAMDLHDELGSALGSIGILSGVLAAHDLPDRERATVAGKIAETASELGTSLSDIVLALDDRSRDIDELASRLAEHGARLFSEDSIQFDIDLQSAAVHEVLPYPIFRSVLLIGLEALHNVARHAQARHVRLSITTTAPAEWQLVIEDDGRGLAAPVTGGGLGMSSMSRRAGEIGARVEWSRPAAGGTRVALRFSTRGRVT